MSTALTIVRHDNLNWYLEDGDKHHPVHLDIGNVGWSVQPTAFLEFNVTSYGKDYRVQTGRSGKNILAVTDSAGAELTRLVIADGHPGAWFFKKTCTFEDGVERVVPIAQTKPSQPY
ncbi:hypothetical protein D3C87_1020680 [compost metagenome]